MRLVLLAGLLAVAAATCALAAASDDDYRQAFRDALNHKVAANHSSRHHSHHFRREIGSGEYVQFSYNVSVGPHVRALESTSATGVSCHPNSTDLVVDFATAEAAMEFERVIEAGHVLTGGANWGCSHNGHAIILRRVVAPPARHAALERSVVVQTAHSSYTEVFEHAHIVYHSPGTTGAAPARPDSPVHTASASAAGGGGSAFQQGATRQPSGGATTRSAKVEQSLSSSRGVGASGGSSWWSSLVGWLSGFEKELETAFAVFYETVKLERTGAAEFSNTVADWTLAWNYDPSTTAVQYPVYDLTTGTGHSSFHGIEYACLDCYFVAKASVDFTLTIKGYKLYKCDLSAGGAAALTAIFVAIASDYQSTKDVFLGSPVDVAQKVFYVAGIPFTVDLQLFTTAGIAVSASNVVQPDPSDSGFGYGIAWTGSLSVGVAYNATTGGWVAYSNHQMNEIPLLDAQEPPTDSSLGMVSMVGHLSPSFGLKVDYIGGPTLGFRGGVTLISEFGSVASTACPPAQPKWTQPSISSVSVSQQMVYGAFVDIDFLGVYKYSDTWTAATASVQTTEYAGCVSYNHNNYTQRQYTPLPVVPGATFGGCATPLARLPYDCTVSQHAALGLTVLAVSGDEVLVLITKTWQPIENGLRTSCYSQYLYDGALQRGSGSTYSLKPSPTTTYNDFQCSGPTPLLPDPSISATFASDGSTVVLDSSIDRCTTKVLTTSSDVDTSMCP